MVRSTPLRSRFVDPKLLASTNNLHLIAKTVVEGFLAGLHRSPYHGFSLDFAEYREYSPGDDIRRVDWKVYGRSDRFYVKKYEGDTNSQVHLLIDTSRSMSYSSHQISKIDYARYLAAALAYLSLRQSDAVGLAAFDSQIREFVPPRTRFGQLHSILHQLEKLEIGSRTNLKTALEQFSRLARRRSLVVLISDFYQEAAELAKTLRYFHHRGNDVLAFHILDPMELEMSIDGNSTLEDLETGEQLPYSIDHSRKGYLEALNSHIGRLRKECRDVQIDYVLMNSSRPLDRALLKYLTIRARRI
jgi:uncharacterized protein (DUF58 family)